MGAHQHPYVVALTCRKLSSPCSPTPTVGNIFSNNSSSQFFKKRAAQIHRGIRIVLQLHSSTENIRTCPLSYRCRSLLSIPQNYLAANNSAVLKKLLNNIGTISATGEKTCCTGSGT